MDALLTLDALLILAHWKEEDEERVKTSQEFQILLRFILHQDVLFRYPCHSWAAFFFERSMMRKEIDF